MWLVESAGGPAGMWHLDNLGCDGCVAVRNHGSMSWRPAALAMAALSKGRHVTPQRWFVWFSVALSRLAGLQQLSLAVALRCAAWLYSRSSSDLVLPAVMRKKIKTS